MIVKQKTKPKRTIAIPTIRKIIMASPSQNAAQSNNSATYPLRSQAKHHVSDASMSCGQFD